MQEVCQPLEPVKSVFPFLHWRQFETGVSFCLDLIHLSRFMACKKDRVSPGLLTMIDVFISSEIFLTS
ncbi:hypothetical protein BSI_28540 [Bacillus inaquosorum KCTC 13429]|uniref:Uncharacterized protein n=1 Tax=Bacillus inaquosorum KCTC 13429 TaxID=1236548 RepID=A0A9W5PCA3_9BACI|nr:hypothetical protein BSI_28540 [Bacillus inaquosorum KCTC 13429]